jgi:broad specificity phosphatase PhoE
VRHADVDTSFGGDDPPLSSLGHRRAELLADALEEIDVVAGVDAIYVADSRRTQQTVAPLARRLELEPRIADPYQVEPFMAEVLREHKGEIVLVATHADILALLVEELHGSKNIPSMDGDNNFDNIYIVTIPWFGKVKTLRLHYALLLPVPGHGVFSDTL